MAKANIKLPDGTSIAIEGSVEEVQKIVALIKRPPVSGKKEEKKQAKSAQTKTKKTKPGLTAYVLELKKEGYFKEERTLEDIIKALKQKGHIYPKSSLSGTVLRLTRKKKLGRIKKDKVWVYVHRD